MRIKRKRFFQLVKGCGNLLLPFDLCNAPAIFERLMEKMLQLLNKICMVYLDNVIIFSEGYESMIERLFQVFLWLKFANLKSNPKKMFFFKEGHKILRSCCYRKFVKDFSLIAKSLFILTENTCKFEWTELCDVIFKELKKRLISSPILTFPRKDGPFILDTDASNYSIEAVLSQIQEEKERIIAYYSKVFSKAEKNYCVTRRELFAVT